MQRHLQNATIIDATGEAPFRGTVTVDDERIAAVTRAPAEPNAAPGDDVIDCSGYTVMPGLTEAHCHISFNNLFSMYQAIEIQPEDHSLLALSNAQMLLQRGFTSLFSAAFGQAPSRRGRPRCHQPLSL
jgi:imidazolonepropionase-like amidohydrolase